MKILNSVCLTLLVSIISVAAAEAAKENVEPAKHHVTKQSKAISSAVSVNADRMISKPAVGSSAARMRSKPAVGVSADREASKPNLSEVSKKKPNAISSTIGSAAER